MTSIRAREQKVKTSRTNSPPIMVTLADAHLFHQTQVTRATYRKTQVSDAPQQHNHARERNPLSPPIRYPDAPLTRFHATSEPTCHPRPHIASKRHTANLERRAAATRGRTRQGTRRGGGAQPQPTRRHAPHTSGQAAGRGSNQSRTLRDTQCFTHHVITNLD